MREILTILVIASLIGVVLGYTIGELIIKFTDKQNESKLKAYTQCMEIPECKNELTGADYVKYLRLKDKYDAEN